MKRLLAFALFVPSIAFAAPVKIPPLSVCAQASGVLVAKKACAKNETRLALSALAVKGEAGAPGPVGPQGPKGEQGIPGAFDVSRCIKREQSGSGFSGVLVSVSCLANEFVAANGCYVASGPGTVVSQKLATGGNALFPNAYGIVSCVGFDPIGSGVAFTITAQAFCCQP